MEPTKVVYDICRHYLADCACALGPSLAEKALGYIRSRSLKELAGISRWFDPELHDRTVLKHLLQLEAFVKKCDHFSSENCKVAAMQSFHESEEICKVTNLRLDAHFDLAPGNWYREKVQRMENIVRSTLGPLEYFLNDLPSLVRSTNGATAAHPRSKSGGAARLKRTMYATERSHPYLQALAAFWGYTYNFRKIHHNRVELVPKNWKTHRTIACEPEGNIALQLAFDEFCKRKLKSRLNIDLSDQSRNQRLAYEGSIHGKLCTVDLQAASDRLSLNVVHLLFDKEWVDFFLDTRSPCWKRDDGTLVPYHKLSSMGNGYTFTVETLVFSAVCKSLGSRIWSVYGDDIIIETHLYSDLVRLLSYLGFNVNQEKSHVRQVKDPLGGYSMELESGHPWEGPSLARRERETAMRIAQICNLPQGKPEYNPNGTPLGVNAGGSDFGFVQSFFSSAVSQDNQKRLYLRGVYRESCGKHYYGGEDITPLFIKSLRTRRDWVLCINNIMRIGSPGGNLWQFARKIVSELNLPLGPPVLDPCAYVFIDVHTSYRLGLIRTFSKGKRFGAFQPVVRALLQSSRTVRCHDSRALFLWFLNRRGSPYESSRYSLGTFKVRSKWVRYYPVMDSLVGGSVHLHWWTESLLASDS